MQARHRAALSEFFARSSRGGHTMARHDDALPLSEMLTAEGGEGINDLLRDIVRDALELPIEEELSAALGGRRGCRRRSRLCPVGRAVATPIPAGSPRV